MELPSREAAFSVAATSTSPAGYIVALWRKGRRKDTPGGRRSGVPPPRQETTAMSPGRTRRIEPKAAAATTTAVMATSTKRFTVEPLRGSTAASGAHRRAAVSRILW